MNTIRIDEKSVHRFGLQSDDGAVLLIDNVETVRNDTSYPGMLGYGLVAFGAGYHKVELRYFQYTEGVILNIWMVEKSPDNPSGTLSPVSLASRF